jgi:hypothetical protein
MTTENIPYGICGGSCGDRQDLYDRGWKDSDCAEEYRKTRGKIKLIMRGALRMQGSFVLEKRVESQGNEKMGASKFYLKGKN